MHEKFGYRACVEGPSMLYDELHCMSRPRREGRLKTFWIGMSHSPDCGVVKEVVVAHGTVLGLMIFMKRCRWLARVVYLSFVRDRRTVAVIYISSLCDVGKRIKEKGRIQVHRYIHLPKN